MSDHQIGFALHQMKRDAMFRDIITAPPGYTLVEFDAAGQEFKWMAVASGDQTMLQLCQPGEDPHGFMGSRINPALSYPGIIDLVKKKDPVAKAARQSGKVGNLSLQYRTSPKTFRTRARVDHGMDMTLPEAARIHFVYQRSYPGVPAYWEKQIALTKECGYVETFAGRRVQVRGDWSGRMGWSMGSTAINYRIQGTGADQKYLALATLTPYLLKVGAKFSYDLHDGLYFLVPDARVSEFCRVAKHMLDTLPYREAWGFTPPVQMNWDCKAGKSWGTMKEFEFDV